MIRQPDYDRIDVVLPGAETGKKWDDEIGEWVVDDEFVEEDGLDAPAKWNNAKKHK